MELTTFKLKAIAVGMAFLILTTGAVGAMAWEPVDEGNVAVVTEWGDATGEVLQPGANWITPVKHDTVTLSTRQQAYTMTSNPGEGAKDFADPIVVKTADGVETTFDVTVRYQLPNDPEQVTEFYTDYKTLDNAEQRMIRTTLSKQMLITTGSMKTSEVYTSSGQTQITMDARERLEEKFSNTGLVLDSVQITKVNFPESYERSITEKEVAQQRELKAEAEVEVAKQEARAQIERAQGEAEANRIVAESVRNNPELIQIRYIEAIQDSEGKTIYLPSDETPTLVKETNEDE
ncbi:SPFH superfamily protein [Haloarcula virus HCTV-8]|uniref:SPFH superfamily protein n=5 Tax=Haloferacalesvirus TaxID=2843389 RepID=A0AAE9BW87_9CAUD|nr:lipoprotein [Halorubrum tailed phage 5]UBF20401.1 SPFH superfamily protein [Haloarcula phage HCTV-7]UBF20517.1 SPFH superfamily protein [Haloarcula phage HCTV-9]UBF20633.1 SPFH superfamily protein [Haloarcula phage HCTV-11]UBF20973.1 SPFH superfamily protein [Haloarcula virus HCTV-8]UBF21085.1 SPFH superfamily protein [Haloarcula virus HCTV-10]UBF21326.1 SPFH superfamily protein [Halorubrum phage HRTV-13]